MATLDNEALLDTAEPPEEIKCSSCSLNESKYERGLVEELVEISDKLFADDEKPFELLIGRGWEEAVCGWGAVSPSACLFPQKKAKNGKYEGASDCILCFEMCQVTDRKKGTVEAKTTKDTSLKDSEDCSDNTPPAGTCSPSQITDHCLSTGAVSKIETFSDTVSTSEVLNEQRKDKATRSETDTSPQVVNEVNSGSVSSASSSYHYNKNAQVVTLPTPLPPLKSPASSAQTYYRLIRNNDGVQQPEKLPSKAHVWRPASGQVVSNVEQKVERRPAEPSHDPLSREQIKSLSSGSSTAPCIPKTPARDLERLYWHCPLISHKTNALSSNSTSTKLSNGSSVGLLHTRAMLNKRNVRQDLRQLNEAKLRSRPKSNTAPLLSSTFLPFLTVTRVEIPVVHHRPL